MRLKSILLTVLGLATATAGYAQADMAPEFLFPNPASDVLISGMSDNGKWAVSQIPAEAGTLTYVGVTLYDLGSYPFPTKTITHTSGKCGASCVTNDGNIIGGFARQSPATYNVTTGEWTLLPLPEGRKSGWVVDITPDGKYAIGRTATKTDMFNDYDLDGCLWDLTTGQLVDVPNKPFIDRTNSDQNQNFFNQISPDGRYIFGVLSFSYIMPMAVTPYVYDRQTDEVHYIGLQKNGNKWTADPSYLDNISEGMMSPDGHYLTGAAYLVKNATDLQATEYDVAYRYDVNGDKLELFDGAYDHDYAGFSIGNSGAIYAAYPAVNPYSFAAIRNGNYYYDFSDIFEELYGVDLQAHSIGNTGKPVYVSEDEKTMVMYTSTSNCYVLKLKEPLTEAVKRMELLGNYTVAPAAGTTMSTINNVSLTFKHPVSVSSLSYRSVVIVDEEGNQVATALQTGGLSTNGTTLNIRFRDPALEAGKTYTVVIPKGTIWIGEDRNTVNPEIRIDYVARGEGAVKMVSSTPADGAKIARLSLTQDPIILTFDSEVMLNETEGQEIIGQLYRADDTTPTAPLKILSATSADKHQMLVAPVNEVELYLNTEYRVEIPAGVAIDLSGNGASEAITLNFTGTYQKPIDDKVLFHSDCSNYQGFLFFEGDKGTPVTEMANIGFTAENTPWYIVRENETSTDMALGAHSRYVDGRQANDWLMTESLHIPDNTAYMTFDSQSHKKDKQDYLKVYVYQSDINYNVMTPELVADILANGDLVYNELQDPGLSEEGFTGDWRENLIPLGDYAGKNVYIAFLNDNQDQSMVIIDNIHVAREIEAAISFTNSTNVVKLDEIEIRGQVIVPDDNEKKYTGIELTLTDAQKNVISTIKDDNVLVDKDNVFSFAFPEKLALEAGKENYFYVDMNLGGTLQTSKQSVVRNLTFSPTRRVVLEEYTGRECPNCPRGLRAIDIIHDTYGDQFIPIALHTYQSDPKGMNVQDYSAYLGLDQIGAPSASVNRTSFGFPMTQNSQTAAWAYSIDGLAPGQVPDMALWFDLVRMYLAEPTTVDVELQLLDDSDNNTMRARATVKSAIDLDNANIRAFGVLLENKLLDYQSNGMSQVSDPVLGEWGRGGIYGDSYVFDVEFNHVAIGTWGTTPAGTPSLLPNQMKASEEYTFDIEMPFPAITKHVYNTDFVIMLIDDITGEVINAAIQTADSGVDAAEIENALLTVAAENGYLKVNSGDEAQVAAYSLDGRMIAAGNGQGSFEIDLNGYTGVVIVKASTADKTTSFKLMTR